MPALGASSVPPLVRASSAPALLVDALGVAPEFDKFVGSLTVAAGSSVERKRPPPKGAARIVTRQVGSAKEQVVGLATAAKKTTYDTIVAGPALIAGWAIHMGWGVLKSLASPFLPPGNKGAPVDAAALGAAVAEVAAAVAEGETSDDEPTLRRRNVARA